jgi:pSer/pThr/pTyr-binding forkhead associated (FHA) protein
MVHPPDAPEAEPEQGDVGHTMIYSAERLRPAEAGPPPPVPQTAIVVAEGRRMVVGATGAVIGRSRDCDIVLGDHNVSRRHAEVRPTDDGWAVNDLGSTNGVLLNGRRINGTAALRGGDRIELGTSELRFELE